jgi:hypothetical protein
MWDQFRGKEEEAPFFKDDELEIVDAPPPKKTPSLNLNLGKYFEEPILGMTAPQRFLISIMLLITVCMLGSMFLMITGKFAFF